MSRSIRLALSIVLALMGMPLGTSGTLWAQSPESHPPGVELVANDVGAELPPGYTISLVTGRLALPTDMAFLPNGDILVTEKGSGTDLDGTAKVRLVHAGLLQAQPVLTLSVGLGFDAGLMSIALDPNFAQNHLLYLWYTPGRKAFRWTGNRINRLSRFRYDPDRRTIDPASEAIVLEDVVWSAYHNGGGLLFDAGGNLLLTTGEGNSSLVEPSSLPQDMGSLNGKVLRIHPERVGYTIPNDNPYVQASGVRAEIYAAGLRNPFRITQRQSDGTIFIADVGDRIWEEVNALLPGANYGWPLREGPCPRGTVLLPCQPDPPNFTPPLLYYQHDSTGNGALSAIAYIENDAFSPELQGHLLIADFMHQSLRVADVSQPAANAPIDVKEFARNVGRIVDMEVTREGLYLLDFGGGRILFIEYAGGLNQAPVANLSASPALGPAPLTVSFSAEGTTDDHNFGLTYRWNFGDGSPDVVTQQPVISRRYTKDGNYRATLTVLDRFGVESETLVVPITVYSGVMPVIVLENLTEPGRELFRGGDRFRYRATRSNGTQGLDPDAPYRWTVELLRGEQPSPLIVGHAARSGEIDLETEAHDPRAALSYRFLLTMTTADGIEVSVARTLNPQRSALLLSTWPAARPILANGVELAPGSTLDAVVGMTYTLIAPAEISHNESVNEFAYWLVTPGWPETTPPAAELEPQIHYSRTLTLEAPATDTAYVAHYIRSRPFEQIFLPTVRNVVSSD